MFVYVFCCLLKYFLSFIMNQVWMFFSYYICFAHSLYVYVCIWICFVVCNSLCWFLWQNSMEQVSVLLPEKTFFTHPYTKEVLPFTKLFLPFIRGAILSLNDGTVSFEEARALFNGNFLTNDTKSILKLYAIN